MNSGIVLSILSIILTIIFGLLPFIIKNQKQYTSNEIYNNINIGTNVGNAYIKIDSIYKNVDNKNYNTNIYLNTAKPNSSTSYPGSNDDFWLTAFIIILIICLGAYFYLYYQNLILITFSLIILLGLTTTIFLYLIFRQKLPLKNSLIAILSWVPLLVIILLVKYPINTPPELPTIKNTIVITPPREVPIKFVELFLSSNNMEILFIFFQLFGLVFLLILIVISSLYCFKLFNGKITDKLTKRFVLTYIWMSFVSCFFISGLMYLFLSVIYKASGINFP